MPGGIVLLIFVVLGTAALDLGGAQQARAGVVAEAGGERDRRVAQLRDLHARARLLALGRGTSRRVVNDDREWLYSNIGSSVPSSRTFDLAIFVPRRTGRIRMGGGLAAGGRDRHPSAGRYSAILGLLATSTGGSDPHADAARPIPRRALVFRGGADDAGGGRPAGSPGLAAGPDPRYASDRRRLAAMGRELLATTSSLSDTSGPARPDAARRLRRAHLLLPRVGGPAPGGEHPAQGGDSACARPWRRHRDQRHQLALRRALGPPPRTGADRGEGGGPQPDRVPVECQPRAQDADERRDRGDPAARDHRPRRRAARARRACSCPRRPRRCRSSPTSSTSAASTPETAGSSRCRSRRRRSSARSPT